MVTLIRINPSDDPSLDVLPDCMHEDAFARRQFVRLRLCALEALRAIDEAMRLKAGDA